jgi:hypothetical protein
MLAPIWGRYSDMSIKVKGRVGQVLNYSHSKGWRPTEAPGRAVTMGLGKRAASTNLAAMPYADVPAFVATLNEKEDTVGRFGAPLHDLDGSSVRRGPSGPMVAHRRRGQTLEPACRADEGTDGAQHHALRSSNDPSETCGCPQRGAAGCADLF